MTSDTRVQKMIEAFDANCAESGHAFAPSPLGGEYCQCCGVTRGKKEEDMTLKTIQQHNDEVAAVRDAMQMSGIACPYCDKNLRWTQTTALSMPPRRGVSCECGWSGQVS